MTALSEAPSEARARSKARRLLLGVTPSNASKVLGHERYWTPQFIDGYLERCEMERLSDPDAAWALVREVPRLLNLIVQLDRPQPGFDLMARAIRCLGLVGEIGAMVEHWKVADDAFRQARHWMRQGRVSPSAIADLHCRHGAALLWRKRIPQAVKRLESALRLHRSLDSPDEAGLAETLLLLSLVKNDEKTTKGLAEILVRVPPKGPLMSRLFDSALSRLLDRRLIRRLGTSETSVMAGWVEMASKRWLSGVTRPRHRPLLHWLEGLMMGRIWMDALGQRRLESAWQRFTHIGATDQMVVCALDLAILSTVHGDPETAQTVLRESRERVRRLTGDVDLQDRLAQWETADSARLEACRQSFYRRLDWPQWSYPISEEWR